jgi:hypothetical protein
MEVFYGSNIFWPFIFVDPATSVPVSVQSLIALPQLEHHGPRMERKMGKRVRKRGKKKSLVTLTTGTHVQAKIYGSHFLGSRTYPSEPVMFFLGFCIPFYRLNI